MPLGPVRISAEVAVAFTVNPVGSAAWMYGTDPLTKSVMKFCCSPYSLQNCTRSPLAVPGASQDDVHPLPAGKFGPLDDAEGRVPLAELTPFPDPPLIAATPVPTATTASAAAPDSTQSRRRRRMPQSIAASMTSRCCGSSCGAGSAPDNSSRMSFTVSSLPASRG